MKNFNNPRIDFIYQVVRTARLRQWLKNLSVFAAPLFFGNLFHPGTFSNTLQAFFVFCFASSGVYIINDIIDVNKDRAHPIKKNRPIASGRLSKKAAWIVASIFLIGSFTYAHLVVGRYFSYAIVAYLLLQLIYSLKLRNYIILDSLTVATGFVIRVFAGGLASITSISSWLALATIGLALLLAFGKRRSEKTILAKHVPLLARLPGIVRVETRKTLRHYPDKLLDSMISMSASFSIITYALFAFQVSPQSVSPGLFTILPSILNSPKWMMLTIPVVIYGVARYLYVIYEKEDAESPERVLLGDKPLLATVVVWGLSILAIIYLPVLFTGN